MDTPEALQARLEACRPSDTLQGLFIECCFTYLGHTHDAEELRALRREALGGQHLKSFRYYPASHALRLVQLGASRATRSVPFAEYMEGLGREVARTYQSSFFGCLVAIVAKNETHAVLNLCPSSYKAAATFPIVRYERTGARSALLYSQGDLLGPAWSAASVQEALLLFCQMQARKRVEPHDDIGLSFTVHLEW